jgi:hypothetical protein
MYISVV